MDSNRAFELLEEELQRESLVAVEIALCGPHAHVHRRKPVLDCMVCSCVALQVLPGKPSPSRNRRRKPRRRSSRVGMVHAKLHATTPSARAQRARRTRVASKDLVPASRARAKFHHRQMLRRATPRRPWSRPRPQRPSGAQRPLPPLPPRPWQLPARLLATSGPVGRLAPSSRRNRLRHLWWCRSRSCPCRSNQPRRRDRAKRGAMPARARPSSQRPNPLCLSPRLYKRPNPMQA